MRNLEDYGTKTQSERLRYKDAIWKITVQRRNLEDYGTKTQSGRLRYEDWLSSRRKTTWHLQAYNPRNL